MCHSSKLKLIQSFLTLCSSEVQGLSVVCWAPSAALFPNEDKKQFLKTIKFQTRFMQKLTLHIHD